MTAVTRRPVQWDVGGGPPLKLEGWEALSTENAEKFAALQEQERLDRASLFRQCFTTDAGRYVLQDMITTYLGKRVVDEHQNSARADGVRQGRQDVVADILFLIEFANTGGGRLSTETTEE